MTSSRAVVAAATLFVGGCLLATRPTTGMAQEPPDPEQQIAPFVGTWTGTLTWNGSALGMTFRIGVGSQGDRWALLDIPDQGVFDVPASSLTLNAPGPEDPRHALTMEFLGVQGSYNGVLGDDGRSISGTWRQSGLSLPLQLAKDARSRANDSTGRANDSQGWANSPRPAPRARSRPNDPPGSAKNP